MRKKRVYVAGALNAPAKDYIQNVHRMIVWGDKVRRLGFSVYIPCTDFLSGVVLGNYEYADYFENSQPWLEVSDAMFVCPGWEDSKGTKKEIKRARDFGVPVYFAGSLDKMKARYLSE